MGGVGQRVTRKPKYNSKMKFISQKVTCIFFFQVRKKYYSKNHKNKQNKNIYPISVFKIINFTTNTQKLNHSFGLS